MRLSAVLNPRSHAREAQLAHALRDVPLFKNLPTDDLITLWRQLERVRAEAGAVICRRGEPGDTVYIVQAGAVDVRLGLSDDAVPLRRLGPGDLFGEMALLTGLPRSADVVAAEESVLWVLDRTSFAGLIQHSVPFLRALADDLCRRIANASVRIESLEAQVTRIDGDVLGTRIGPYRVMQQIGAGGMAIVYGAVHGATDEAVALKVLPAAWTGKTEFRERFMREVAVLQRVNHPNVIRVRETGTMRPPGGATHRDSAGEEDQAPAGIYLAMEWFPNALDRVLRAKYPEPLPAAMALDITRQVADGLTAVHALGIVHRDVKPSNILLRADGTPVLADFGLVLDPAARQQRLTATNVLVGTADYMAPEQITGAPLDGRSDLYALGVVLYELLTGHVPFAGHEPYEILRAHVEEPPPPLPDSVPPAAAAVVQRALRKRPEERFASAEEMADAVETALHSATPAEVAI
jgi:CRP-like cAMP-binding protein